ncbi:protein timeless-like [Myzus persicae]|uniref:protein timeless-like n=1 Tax=Myzus persicae TaxID=13164 RepID=UPI000B92FAEB|nr:protein timeless-like [Myzus persicae]
MEDSLKHHNTENLLNQLRICIANDYLPSDNCYIILWHIYKQLIKTGESSINFRQLIGSSEVLKKDLIPMLVAVNDSKILSVLIKVLTNLITPIECIILDTKQHVNRFEHSNVIKLKQLLLKSKIWWTDSRSIKRIIQIIKKYIEELSKPLGCFSIYAVPIISDCLLLIRNILIVDDDQCQRRMLLILFCEQFGETLMVLIHNSLRRKWAAQVIELIALVFQNDEVAAKMNTIIINYSKNNMASYYP